MPLPQRPSHSRGSRRRYSVGGPRIGGALSSLAGGAGRMLQRGIYSGIRGLSRSGRRKPQQKKSGKFSSAYFKKKPYMQRRKAKSIISGMRGSKDAKILAELRMENQTYDPRRKNEPNFSWNEGNQTVARVKKIYGDKIAKEVEQKLHRAFQGKHTISGAEAQKHLMGVSQYGKDVREGIGLIAQNFDKRYQGDSASNYITEEKLENIIKETAKRDKYAAHSLREEFLVTQEEGKPGKPSAGNKATFSGWSVAKKLGGSMLGSSWRSNSGASGNAGSTQGSSQGNNSQNSSQDNSRGSSMGSNPPA